MPRHPVLIGRPQLGWVQLSPGNLLRTLCHAGGPHPKLIMELLANKKLTPDEIMVTLLKDEIEQITRPLGQTNLLLDGFALSTSNLTPWHNAFGRNAEPLAMLFFECPLSILEKRIPGRAPYSGRGDDNAESMKLRFETFKAETFPKQRSLHRD